MAIEANFKIAAKNPTELGQPDLQISQFQPLSKNGAEQNAKAINHLVAQVVAQNEPGPGFIQLPEKAREAGFALRHPFIANDIGKVEPGSNNISTKTFRFSTQVGLKENAAHEGSEVNAYRHTLWQATIAGKYGQQIAHEVGNAHEENPSVDLSARYFSGKGGLSKADQTVDLLNNQIGRQIAKENPGASMKQLARKALDYFHDKGLYTAVEKSNRPIYHVEQTKISDQQYRDGLKALESLDENGRKK